MKGGGRSEGWRVYGRETEWAGGWEGERKGGRGGTGRGRIEERRKRRMEG